MKRRLWLGACLAAVLAASCKHEEPEPTAKASVSAVALAAGDVVETVELQGRLEPPPSRDASLAPQVAGRLTSVAVREGDRVKAGDLLASVEEQSLEESERAAAAELAKARQETAVKTRAAATTAKLFEKGIASAEERDNDASAAAAARAAEADADAKLSAARRQRGWARLTAPFDGVVAQVTKHAGEAVDGTPGTPVLRLLGTGAVEVAADATSADLARMKVGQRALVSGAGDATPRAAELVRLPGAVDPADGLGEVRARLEAPPPAPLLSAVVLRVVVAERRGVLVAPARALRRSEEGGEELVFVEAGAAHPRPVKTGLHAPDSVEIVSGAKAGDVVVVDSPLGLKEGAALDVKR